MTDDPAALVDLWRQKQLEYTWLRSLMGRYQDFWTTTGDALDYSLERLGIPVDEKTRGRLLNAWLAVRVYPEVPEALGGGRRPLAVLSNGNLEMLETSLAAAGIHDRFEHVLSVDEVGVYKPHPSVYELAVKAFGLPAEQILFVSSNPWDAAGAGTFGFPVAWVDRTGVPSNGSGSRPTWWWPTWPSWGRPWAEGRAAGLPRLLGALVIIAAFDGVAVGLLARRRPARRKTGDRGGAGVHDRAQRRLRPATDRRAGRHSAPASPTTVPADDEGPPVILKGDGIGAFLFGADPDQVLAGLTLRWGPPDGDSGWITARTSPYGPCPGSVVRGVDWRGFTVLFSDGSAGQVDGEPVCLVDITAEPGCPRQLHADEAVDEGREESRRLQRTLPTDDPLGQEQEPGGGSGVGFGRRVRLRQEVREEELIGAGRPMGEGPVAIRHDPHGLGRILDVEGPGRRPHPAPLRRRPRSPGSTPAGRRSVCRATERGRPPRRRPPAWSRRRALLVRGGLVRRRRSRSAEVRARAGLNRPPLVRSARGPGRRVPRRPVRRVSPSRSGPGGCRRTPMRASRRTPRLGPCRCGR